jgi:hypothetical protein
VQIDLVRRFLKGIYRIAFLVDDLEGLEGALWLQGAVASEKWQQPLIA